MMKFVMTLKSMMLAVACCLVMPFSLQAQDVIISGRLVDDQQQPVEYQLPSDLPTSVQPEIHHDQPGRWQLPF